jgi:hypothetical protein
MIQICTSKHISFNPARFLSLSAEESDAGDPRNFAFGLAAILVSVDIVYIAVASLLACFKIRRKVVHGKEIIPNVESRTLQRN